MLTEILQGVIGIEETARDPYFFDLVVLERFFVHFRAALIPLRVVDDLVIYHQLPKRHR